MPVNLQSADAAECGDGELRMVMKRLTKRDAVTKLKVIDFILAACAVIADSCLKEPV